MRSDDELKRLALDIFNGQVFTSAQVAAEHQDLIPQIFLPLALMDADQAAAMKRAHVAGFFEYLDQAASRTINGYPMFFSVRCLTHNEIRAVQAYLRRLHDAVFNAIGIRPGVGETPERSRPPAHTMPE